MKRFLFLLLAAVGGLWGQNNQAPPPDCAPVFGTFTANGNTTWAANGAGDNRNIGCTTWVVVYEADSTVSAVTVTFQSAPGFTAVPVTGAFVTFIGTAVTGYANPTSTIPGGIISLKNGALSTPWLRVNVSGYMGTGNVRVVFYGYRTGYTAGTGTGGGTVSSITQACGITATPNPIVATGTILSNGVCVTVANEAMTGTTVNKLAKLTGAPSTAIISGSGDTVGALGIVDSGAGTAGSAIIKTDGEHSCVFDGATTAGHYVGISASVSGDCTDAGAAFPASGQVIGQVLSTNVGAGTYTVDMSLGQASVTVNNICTDSPAPGAWAPTITANHTYCLTDGTYTVSTSAIAVNAANVMVVCSGSTITRATVSVNLFEVTAAHFSLLNCIVDGNSVNGGSLVVLNAGSDYTTIQGNTFQNAGTNSAKGVIEVSAGDGNIINANKGLSITDTFILADGVAASTGYGKISNNYVTGTNPIINLSTSMNAVHRWSVITNKVLSSGGPCFKTGGSVNNIPENSWINNSCVASGTMSSVGYLMNGLVKATFSGNIYDGALQTNVGGMDLSDCSLGTITGNTVTNAWNYSIEEIDAGPCNTTGNNVEVAQAPSVGVTTYGILITEAGSGNPGNVVSSNNVTWLSGVNYQGASTAIQVYSTTAHSTGRCVISDNNIYDAGAALAASATINGIVVGISTGTTNNCVLTGNNISMPAVGIGTSSTALSIGSASTGTLVNKQKITLGASAVAISDAGTSTVFQAMGTYAGNGSTNSVTTTGGAAMYMGVGVGSPATAQNAREFIISTSGTLAYLRVKTTSSQPGTGSMVCSITINGTVASALTVTFAALDGAETKTDLALSHSVPVLAGDLGSLQCVNNASTASANLGAWSVGLY